LPCKRPIAQHVSASSSLALPSPAAPRRLREAQRASLAAPAAPACPSAGPDWCQGQGRAAPRAGDFVDRGAWGLEVLAVLAAWKLAAPGSVTLLRGNHESATCTAMYGFRAELAAKYGAVRAGGPGRGASAAPKPLCRFVAAERVGRKCVSLRDPAVVVVPCGQALPPNTCVA